MTDSATVSVRIKIADLEKWASEYGIADGNVISDVESYIETAISQSAAGLSGLLHTVAISTQFDAPEPRPTQAVSVRCDTCGVKVPERQAAKYDALGVDWALCRKHETH